MSKPNPKSHPWHEAFTATRHSPETVARVIAALAHASQTEVAAAAGLSRGAICGLVARAKAAGVVVVHKRGRKPTTAAPIKRIVTPVSKLVAVTPTPSHDTGVTILTVRVGQCRALDDRRECCCLPTVAGSSWCAGHRAMYVASVRRAA